MLNPKGYNHFPFLTLRLGFTQINIYDIVLLSETHIGYDTAVESDKFLLAPQSSHIER
jgi:hypothetical protein